MRRARGLAIGTAATVMVVPSLIMSSASADDVTTTADSAAHGHGLFVGGLGLDVAGSARAQSAVGTNPGPNTDDLNLTVLEGLIDANLGTVELPLITPTEGGNGLLFLGDLGTLSSRAASPSTTNSVASSGIINQDGSLNVDTADGGDFQPATLDLTRVLGQVLGADAVSKLISSAEIQIGALGARAEKNGTAVTSQYAVSDLRLNVDSPLVEGLTADIETVVNDAVEPVLGLTGPGSAISTLVAGVVDTVGALPLIDAQAGDLSVDTAPLTASVRRELLAEPLSNAEGSVTVNLADGTIGVDLARFVIDAAGVDDLNSLPANTEVLSGAVTNAILDGVSDALVGPGANSLVSKTTRLVTEGIYDVGLRATIDVSAVGGIAQAPVTVRGTLGGFLGQEGAADPVVDTSGLTALGIPLDGITGPLTAALSGLVGDIGAPLEPAVTDVVGNIQPNLTAAMQPLMTELLDGALEPVLERVVDVTINEQPTAAPINGTGDLGAASFTVRALSLRILPGTANVGVELGSASVRALDAADDGNGGGDGDGNGGGDGDGNGGGDGDGNGGGGGDGDGSGGGDGGGDGDGSGGDANDGANWYDDANASHGNDSLASTGSSFGLMHALGALALMALGVGAMVTARRRTNS